MIDLFKSTFLIREEFYQRAAQAILPIIPGLCEEVEESDTPDYILIIGFAKIGLFMEQSDDGHGITIYGNDPWYFNDEGIALMEKTFKVISRVVEPGGYLEFTDDGNSLVRYMFLYDAVERWSVPHVLYTRKEAI